MARVTSRLSVAAFLAALAATAAPAPAPAPAASRAKAAPAVAPVQAPIPRGEKVAWTHAPYAAGDCSICHERADARNPGAVTRAGADLCLQCHDEFQSIARRKHPHAPVKAGCVACHNAHDARHPKLLHADVGSLCVNCHGAVKATADAARVKHGALAEGKKCVACHDPHGSDVEKLLTQLPFDLCVSCHSADGVKDPAGKSLVNFRSLLADNKVWHGPVEAKDCSACHQPHGSDHFRLLVSGYPAEFYASYDPKNYELCFSCHNADVARNAETLTLTGFRDGNRNLHFVHVNKVDRGRTCRACHEVHASKQAHQIRDAVPFGPRGWALKVGYTRTENGGSCSRTCHDTKTYDRKSPAVQVGLR